MMTAATLDNRYNLAEYFFTKDSATDNLFNVEFAIDLLYAHSSDAPTQIALTKYLKGEQPSLSSDLLGETTAGFGQLSEYGDWQYPLPPKFVYRFLVTKQEA